jgi:hypothetical protein
MPVLYRLAGQDLAGVRFAISPLNELVLSLRSWRDPGRYPVHLPWIRRTEQVRDRLDTEMLLALITEWRWTPDFLTPRPHSPLTRLEDELALVAATPSNVVRRDLLNLYRDEQLIPGPLRDPHALGRAVDALTGYWAPWPGSSARTARACWPGSTTRPPRPNSPPASASPPRRSTSICARCGRPACWSVPGTAVRSSTAGPTWPTACSPPPECPIGGRTPGSDRAAPVPGTHPVPPGPGSVCPGRAGAGQPRYGGATPQPQCGTGASRGGVAPGWELAIASRVPHSM